MFRPHPGHPCLGFGRQSTTTLARVHVHFVRLALSKQPANKLSDGSHVGWLQGGPMQVFGCCSRRQLGDLRCPDLDRRWTGDCSCRQRVRTLSLTGCRIGGCSAFLGMWARWRQQRRRSDGACIEVTGRMRVISASVQVAIWYFYINVGMETRNRYRGWVGGHASERCAFNCFRSNISRYSQIQQKH
ncbi:hypothetical protein BCR44DRAFT_263499 [Catenaria anguillulae PL171]|uniref:Uncharacterized protein n=1 Tax=Catenaria anguillulae PL171 TaxID=765915 RepID=A0A1Y2H543_9FUNG|nr:hypothetical protein BCR44DRAFT_263499 [Catenaria anguillulae PL171]